MSRRHLLIVTLTRMSKRLC